MKSNRARGGEGDGRTARRAGGAGEATVRAVVVVVFPFLFFLFVNVSISVELSVVHRRKYTGLRNVCLGSEQHRTCPQLCVYVCVCVSEPKDAPLAIWKVVWGPGIPIRPRSGLSAAPHTHTHTPKPKPTPPSWAQPGCRTTPHPLPSSHTHTHTPRTEPSSHLGRPSSASQSKTAHAHNSAHTHGPLMTKPKQLPNNSEKLLGEGILMGK